MNKIVVSLFDESGNALRPWAEAGFQCFAFDILNQGNVETIGGGSIEFVNADLFDRELVGRIIDLKPRFVMGFPPCTDLAVSGAAWFEAKRRVNPNFQDEAVALARTVETVGEACNVAWFCENPISVLSSLWRKPNYIFSPNEYGGYLPEDDVHPRWPDYIAARDAYPKKTCIWSNDKFVMPPRKVIAIEPGYSVQHRKLGGKSAKTKQIRSEGPRGFLKAVKIYNSWG